MATKKAPAKKAPVKKPSVKPPSVKPLAKPKALAKPVEQKFSMPVEVSNWIDQAVSRMAHMQSQIDRLKKENTELKAYRKFAEHRILRSEHE